MTTHDEKPAGRGDSPFSETDPKIIPPPKQSHTGKRVALNWLIMIGGFCAIAVGAQFLIG
ncbi:hypothetical protein [Paracoccus laeviglucosivorans]|uniref:Uncharacterized protein n=1 Tax=Paracoccus laeviglucosivorans TaxID=1197861 RepID=A0A521E8N4_9RHOB|nr:hypothetical protein [Paracoccus laeviglucosivorans]SMO79530.1 hypothetical protein SAMN06265221_11199 [Paracoccus laeviglucosivorans]